MYVQWQCHSHAIQTFMMAYNNNIIIIMYLEQPIFIIVGINKNL